MNYLAAKVSCLLAVGLLVTCKSKDSNPPPAPPTASFTSVGPFSAGDSTRFTNESTNATSYKWDFGDGGTATAAVKAHVYKQPGQYTVKLEVTNAGGSDSQTRGITIYSPPAGSTCNCKIISYQRTGPVTRLPDKEVAVYPYDTNGIAFNGITYVLLTDNATVSNYRSTNYTGSTGGEITFTKATDSLLVGYHSGGLGSPTFVNYHCKRQY